MRNRGKYKRPIRTCKVYIYTDGIEGELHYENETHYALHSFGAIDAPNQKFEPDKYSEDVYLNKKNFLSSQLRPIPANSNGSHLLPTTTEHRNLTALQMYSEMPPNIKKEIGKVIEMKTVVIAEDSNGLYTRYEKRLTLKYQKWNEIQVSIF